MTCSHQSTQHFQGGEGEKPTFPFSFQRRPMCWTSALYIIPLEACSLLLARHDGRYGLRFMNVLQAQLLWAPSAPSISWGCVTCISHCAHQPLQTSFPSSPEFYLAQINILNTADSTPSHIHSVVIVAVHGEEEIPKKLCERPSPPPRRDAEGPRPGHGCEPGCCSS